MTLSKASTCFFLLGSAAGVIVTPPVDDATALLQSIPEESREVREHRQRKVLEEELFQESLRMKILKENHLKQEDANLKAHAEFREEQKLRDAEALAVRKRTIKKLQEQQDKENEWRAHQGQLAEERAELKVRVELLAKATKVREEAEVAAKNLTRGSIPEHMVEGMSMVDVVETLNGVSKTCNDDKFVGSVTQLAENWQNQIAALTVGAKESVATFVAESSPQTVTRGELTKNLIRFLQRSESMIAQYQKDATHFATEISRMRGSKDIVSLFAPVAQIEAAPATAVPNMTEHTMDYACSRAASLVSSLSPVYKNLAKTRASLTSAAKLTPMIDALIPNSPKNLEVLSRKLLDVSLMDAIAMEDTARDIVSKAGPVVLARHRCTWSAASPRAAFGLVAMLVSLAVSVSLY